MEDTSPTLVGRVTTGMAHGWGPEQVAEAAEYACVLEASAEKPGNVTPTRSFGDMTYADMLVSAAAIGPEMGRAGTRGTGATILAAISETRRWVRVNTNLGMVLLLAPLACAALDGHSSQASLRGRLGEVLRGLDVDDASATYEAIRRSRPGGLGRRVEHDVRDRPEVTLLAAMQSAAGRDSIAAEYVSDYRITYEVGLPILGFALGCGLAADEAVVHTFLELLSNVPDTLVARKCGDAVAQEVSDGAAGVLRVGGLLTAAGRRAAERFDTALRDPAHTLNPGTTADLVTATIFIALLEGML